MQELMSRHKTYSLSPRDCLKTCLFQKWQRMVAPPGKVCPSTPAFSSIFFLGCQHIDIAAFVLTFVCVIVPIAEPARQAPNKRRKRKMSGGSTVSAGGGNNNNSNSKKKSPASSFALSSQVPVSITFWFTWYKLIENGQHMHGWWDWELCTKKREIGRVQERPNIDKWTWSNAGQSLVLQGRRSVGFLCLLSVGQSLLCLGWFWAPETANDGDPRWKWTHAVLKDQGCPPLISRQLYTAWVTEGHSRIWFPKTKLCVGSSSSSSHSWSFKALCGWWTELAFLSTMGRTWL